jgi:hypothetical protein
VRDVRKILFLAHIIDLRNEKGIYFKSISFSDGADVY